MSAPQLTGCDLISGNLEKNIGCAELLVTLPENLIDLTVTSPPYDDLRTYKGFTFDYKPIVDQLYRVTAPGGVVVWVVADATITGSETGTSFAQALYFKEVGFNPHDTMIYFAEKPPLTHNRYEQKFEYMFVFSKGKPKTFNPIMEPCKFAGSSVKSRTFRQTAEGVLEKAHKTEKVAEMKIKGNVWKYAVGPSSATDKIARRHPAVFPEGLAEDHIKSWSNLGDLVLDPMTGSGTTGKMAILNGRRFLGFDISPEYIEIARERLSCVMPLVPVMSAEELFR